MIEIGKSSFKKRTWVIMVGHNSWFYLSLRDMKDLSKYLKENGFPCN